MKISNIQSQKLLINLLHALFWFISFNFWYVILNPGVESTTVIQGLEVEWGSILLVNFLLLIYCALPAIWLFRKVQWWLKVPISVLFLVPIGYVIIQQILPDGNKEDVDFFVSYFVKNFLYVLVFHASIATAVYFNLKVLLVRYLNQVHFKAYLLYFLGLCLGTATLNFAVFDYGIDLLFPELYYISYFQIWELGLIVAFYLIFTSSLALIWQYTQMLIANRDAARNQLSALKAQINPHFLFNNLNTIYSMATANDNRTPDVILKLSDFLRYVLYDTASDKIPLEKEIEIIKTYIGLQKERISPEITPVVFETAGDFGRAEIAPLLLLPLVENCFKHGIGKSKAEISIRIGFHNGLLSLKTLNHVALREAGTENGGIGIGNVEKRLNLIYSNRYTLDFQEKDGLFSLELKVQLD